MRILGGHDYFDSALAYGRDETLVFPRRNFEDAPVLPYRSSALGALHRDTLSFSGGPRQAWRRDGSVTHKSVTYEFRPQVIWFAGKRYGGIRVSSHPVSRLAGQGDQAEWFWSLDKFMGFLDTVEGRLSKPREWGDDMRHITSGNIREHFEAEGKASEVGWLVDNRVSIAVWNHAVGFSSGTKAWHEQSGWKVDVDGLGQMGFAKRLAPYAAFQELSMWIGGVLPRSVNQMVEIKDEKVMLDKHGMDEWSFRRPPSGRM